MIGRLLLLTLLATSAGACDSSGKLNHFIVPAGYTGPITVVSDATFVSSGHWEKNRYVHVVPESAVVCVRSDKMLRPSFRLTGMYTDGTVIFSNFNGLPAPPDERAVRIEAFGSWGGGTDDSYVHWFGVGTEKKVIELEGLFFGGGIEHAMPHGVVIDKWNNNDYAQFRPYCSTE